MTEDDFLAVVYAAKEFCHYAANKTPNMLRWQVTGGNSKETTGKDTSQVAAHATSIIKIKFIDASYILRGRINWCFSDQKHTQTTRCSSRSARRRHLVCARSSERYQREQGIRGGTRLRMFLLCRVLPWQGGSVLCCGHSQPSSARRCRFNAARGRGGRALPGDGGAAAGSAGLRWPRWLRAAPGRARALKQPFHPGPLRPGAGARC